MNLHRVSQVVMGIAALLAGALTIGSGQPVVPIKPPLVTPLLPGGIEVVFQVSLDKLARELPEKLMVYRTYPDPEGMAQRTALEHFLGKSAYFEVEQASGGVFCADLSRLWAKAPQPGDKVPTLGAQTLRAAVQEFLTAIRGIPGDKTTVSTSTDRMEFVDPRGTRQSLPLGYNVTYRRLLEGYEVIGPGGKIKVFLDLGGQVAGYLRVWRKLAPVGEKALISVYEAAERFKKDPLGTVLLADVKRVVVSELRLAYLARGMADPQRYLQPIFLFTCTAYTQKGEQTQYVRYMEALSQPPESLWPEGGSYSPEDRPRTLPKPGED